MASTAIDIVRSAVSAYSARDVERLIAHLHPDVEWEPAGPAALERAAYRGRDDFIAANAMLWQVWDVLRFEEQEVQELGEGSVLWLGRVRLKGHTSELVLDQEHASLFAVTAGLLRRIKAFTSWSEARAAAGLDDHGDARTLPAWP
jgi:ketosteroid isomerase-like protein